MSYNEHNVTELELYAENDSDIYHRKALPIQKNLKRKIERGAYDPEKAEKAWLYWADAAAKKYTKEFDTPASATSFGAFSKDDRKEVARRQARQFEDQLKLDDQQNG